MTGQGTYTDLDYLAWTIARFGADLDRWPDEDRRALKHLIDSSSDASRMLEEARAVDRLLDMAPDVRASEDLVSRIVAAAARDRGHIDADVIRFRPRAKSGTAEPWRRNWTWPSAAVLAASLLLGLYIGAAGFIDPALTNGVDVALLDDSIASAFPELSFEEHITLSEDFL
ncbi:MAG: hypothetical protein ACR2OX_08805 [Methyloligellaceae bacterium]